MSALSFAPDSLATAADLKKPVVLMHAKGDPATMQDNPSYVDVVIEVYDFLERRIEAAVAAGLPRQRVLSPTLASVLGKRWLTTRPSFKASAYSMGLACPF